MILTDDYLRKATIERVIDGDTFICIIDLGLRIYKKATVRLNGVDCPEIKGINKAAGIVAKNFTKEWFSKNTEFIILTLNSGKEDSFGRLLAEVYPINDDNSLSQTLLTNKLAVQHKYS